MEPSFHEEERVMVLKVLYDIQRGDVIIFSSAENCQKDLIKRVIGLPGDHVKIKDGTVTINGRKLDEPYLRTPIFHYHEEKEEWVPPGKYYVLGDNRPDSQDSRVFHSIDASTIKGKVILRWWPVKSMESF
jgi:signal peptidase I